jgi:ATP-dependent Lon protease
LKAAKPLPPLGPEQASFRADVGALGISSSRDVEPAPALGDPRGEEALSLALDIRSPGYHVYASGLEGPKRLERVAQLVRGKLKPGELSDWVYVNNFSDPGRPRALKLRTGEGARLRTALANLIAQLRQDLPKAFREEVFDEERARILDAFQRRQHEEEQRLNELAASENLGIQISQQGNITVVPLIGGKPIDPPQFEALRPDLKNQFEEAHKRFQHELRDHFARSREERMRVDEEIHEIEKEFARRLVKPKLESIATGFENPALAAHLNELLEHLVDHLEPFRATEPPSLPLPIALLAGSPEDQLSVYEVNVVVDNSRTAEPPTLVVDGPTYKSLFGSIDREVTRTGQLTTDFRKIRAGALLEADGGAIVVDVLDVLVEPFVWRILRRTLRSGRVEIEAYDPFVMFTTVGLRPEPIEVDTRVVLVGPRWVFEMLLVADEEFGDLFKILADFSPVVELDEASMRLLCGRIAKLCQDEGLPDFDADALAALVELAVREAGDRRRIHVGGELVLDAAREAGAIAHNRNGENIGRDDVAQSVRARAHRLDRIERDLREAVERGIVLLNVEGERVGQLNALSVGELSSRRFGRAGRVTASVGLGQKGVVNIEREAKLSGSTHDKGMLILEGFLRDRFARSRPLSLVASVAFEQSYGSVDGDSASLAELLAILSRIGGFALRQDLAVTGSVNQAGEVQAVGGVNEKIEGFFHCCRDKGCQGEQGVVIPYSNIEHLVLSSDVVATRTNPRRSTTPWIRLSKRWPRASPGSGAPRRRAPTDPLQRRDETRRAAGARASRPGFGRTTGVPESRSAATATRAPTRPRSRRWTRRFCPPTTRRRTPHTR